MENGCLAQRGVLVCRLVVALDPDVGVSSPDLAAAWDRDEEARVIGSASVDDSIRADFLTDALALVVIPLMVNVASSAAYDIVRRLVTGLRPARPEEPGLEFIETVSRSGDRVLVVRLQGIRK